MVMSRPSSSVTTRYWNKREVWVPRSQRQLTHTYPPRPYPSHDWHVRRQAMTTSLEAVVTYLLQHAGVDWPPADSTEGAPSPRDMSGSRLSIAFLHALGSDKDKVLSATAYLRAVIPDKRWGPVASFYFDGIALVTAELDQLKEEDAEALVGLNALAKTLSVEPVRDDRHALDEAFWSAFFPEGAGIRGYEQQRRKELVEQRTIAITTLPTERVTDPGRQLLLTTNALLTVPTAGTAVSSLPHELAEPLQASADGGQSHWYDHPVPLGVVEEQNEILLGLKALDTAIAFEKSRGVVDSSMVMPLVMSVSVTHNGLTPLARRYVEDLLTRSGGLQHLDVHIFTEADTQRLIHRTLVPAVRRYLPHEDANVLDEIGVGGPYGRHYSFLKSIARWWSVMVDPEIICTFKFDLDQVFPQERLVTQTGQSAMEHFTNPTWGATGLDAQGAPVDLGMMAGSLVNARDVEVSLFTPDVDYPTTGPMLDEMVFWSALPQALSTSAEMDTRYRAGGIDGIQSALERVHVTGGTTAIRVDALGRHRPFTPGFIGRAEDQAYLLSALGQSGCRLACLHNDTLVMRHDAETIARESISAASVGKLIGDYERLILFSAYARATEIDVSDVKRQIDPFTGCFVSRMPLTVTYLRFALRTLRFLAEDGEHESSAFSELGAVRISDAISFVSGSPSKLDCQLDRERRAWELFYDVLDAVEDAVYSGDPYATSLLDQAQELLDDIQIRKQ